ncbi:ABC transporter ATP-binding protein [Desulfotruncus alcoholivorax]|uniref:ABC transporter ATP-binding protein n=1 Tax=Desulfotruncus alcoholivorax TaxID=265477 RepID=UPI00040204E4|nr:ABC transporter ATP-binding protein [Desulfotruncus alcoholivorax]
MSSDDIAIRVSNLSKCYHIYDRSQDRLKQYIIPRLQRLVGRQPKNYFREFWALKEVSFEVKKGETVGIIGRNGSGKSTLLQIICGTLSPTSGTVEANGRIAALLELGSGFNPEFTGRENVYMNGAVIGLSKDEIDARFDDIEAFADIGNFIDQPVKMYSSGMVVRLAFAVSACIEPDILIVDEALAVGDTKFQTKCFRRFEELVARGTTILFVTHSTEQVVRHCHWAIFLDKGQIVMRGHSRDIVNAYLDMLFGVERVKQPYSDLQIKNLQIAGNTQSISRIETDKFENRAGYNPYEYRWGNREAEIFDFCVSTGGSLNTTRIETGQPVVITMWVKFHRRVEFPIYGLTIKTPDGVTLFGSNSRDFDNGPLFLPVDQGAVYKISFTLRDQRLGAGEYLLSVGVAEDRAGEIFPLDRRYDAICLHVINRSSRSFGLADFSMNVEVTVAS